MSENIKRDFSLSLYKSITSAQHALGDSQKSGHRPGMVYPSVSNEGLTPHSLFCMNKHWIKSFFFFFNECDAVKINWLQNKETVLWLGARPS